MRPYPMEFVEAIAVRLCEADPVDPMGWEDITERWQDRYRTLARTALDAVAEDPRVAIVDLPEPYEEDGMQHWPVEQHWQGRRLHPGSVFIRRTDGLISATSMHNPNDCPSDAKSLAAALWAAAEYKEAVERGEAEPVSSGYTTGDHWETRDGNRVIVIQGEGAAWRGERMFLVRTVSNKHTQYGRLGGSRLLSHSGLLRKYRRLDMEADQ